MNTNTNYKVLISCQIRRFFCDFSFNLGNFYFTVILCGGQSTTDATITITPMTTATDSNSPSQSTPTADSNPPLSTKPLLTSTSESITVTTDEGATPEPSSGLSAGAIAGIVIGSIAGVALLGEYNRQTDFM